MWYRIESNYFVAGIIVDEYGICFKTAPILKWMLKKHINWIVKKCKHKKWEINKLWF